MSKTTQKSLDDFLREASEEEEEHRTSDVEYEDRTTLKAEFDKVYENYIVEGYTSDIESEYGGTNTAVRMTSPDGAKMTLWVGSVEQNIFHEKISHWEKQGHSLPVKISFARTKATSGKSGREYNKLTIKTIATGEEVALELETL
jgi:hypothetical protein|tara:strand:+ start:348 stop:782 length:435 start_codon:yes stop_codon:yes gene_type:complete